MKKEKEVNLNWQIFRGLMVIIILLIITLVGSNVGWFLYNSQFETVTETTITGTQTLENVTTVNDVIQDID